MSFVVFDMRGNELKVDDQVVGAFTYGSSACLRIGVIVELKTVVKKNQLFQTVPPNYYLKVRWVEGWGRPEKPSLIKVVPNDKCNLLRVNIDGIN